MCFTRSGQRPVPDSKKGPRGRKRDVTGGGVENPGSNGRERERMMAEREKAAQSS